MKISLVYLGYQLRSCVSDLRMHIGHGGSKIVEHLKNNVFNNLSDHPGLIKDTKNAIGRESCQTTISLM